MRILSNEIGHLLSTPEQSNDTSPAAIHAIMNELSGPWGDKVRTVPTDKEKAIESVYARLGINYIAEKPKVTTEALKRASMLLQNGDDALWKALIRNDTKHSKDMHSRVAHINNAEYISAEQGTLDFTKFGEAHQSELQLKAELERIQDVIEEAKMMQDEAELTEKQLAQAYLAGGHLSEDEMETLVEWSYQVVNEPLLRAVMFDVGFSKHQIETRVRSMQDKYSRFLEDRAREQAESSKRKAAIAKVGDLMREQHQVRKVALDREQQAQADAAKRLADEAQQQIVDRPGLFTRLEGQDDNG